MRQPSKTPRAYLHGILLSILTPSGPHLPFHYPSRYRGTSSSSRVSSSRRTTSDDTSSSSSSGSWDSSSSSAGASDSSDDEAENADGETAEDEDDAAAVSSTHTGRVGKRDGAGGSSRRVTSGGGGAKRTMEVDDEGGSSSSDRDSSKTGRRRSSPSRRQRRKRNREDKSESQQVYNEVEGFNIDALAKILSPTRAFHKKKFELEVDGKVFLGCPMFVREDGSWRKRRRRKEKTKAEVDSEKMAASGTLHPPGQSSARSSQHISNGHAESSHDDEVNENEDGNPPLDTANATSGPDDEGPPPKAQGSFDTEPGTVSEAETEAKSVSTQGPREEMTMFNVVFVMSPNSPDQRNKTREMYENVVRNFAKALKYEQARSSFVWEESRKLLTLKDKAKENRAPIGPAWSNLVAQSSLAKAIATIYDAISNSKIAHVNLNGTFDTSLQIPQAISTPFAPTPTEPQRPGLWLTTANVIDEEGLDPIPSEHSALLLLEDADRLLKEIEGDAKELSAPLAFFIRNSTPRKSLKKLSVACSISLPDLQIFARHLIYWRRARAIPPLHPRDTYIVSPNADMRALSTAIPAYAATFPSLPSLPKMLSTLSTGPPRAYGNYFPSKDHGAAYMEILAWLMRGGWVTQLRTFGWVRVPAEVKAEVDQIIEKEERERSEPNPDALDRTDSSSPVAAFKPVSPALSNGAERKSDTVDGGDRSISTPNASHLSPARPASEAGSSSSRITAIPAVALASPAQVRRPSATAAPPSAGDTVKAGEKKTFTASLVQSPYHANALEARWLEYIGSHFLEPGTPAAELWPSMLRYLDGRTAIEEMPGREGLKRKRVMAALLGLREKGWVWIVRHW